MKRMFIVFLLSFSTLVWARMPPVYRIACKEEYWVTQVKKNDNKITCSSFLPGTTHIDYYAHNTIDGDHKTAWCAKDGVGEFIIVEVKRGLQGFRIKNGLTYNSYLYYANNRIKGVYIGIITEHYAPPNDKDMSACGRIGKYDVQSITYSELRMTLKDTPEWQTINFVEENRRFSLLKYPDLESELWKEPAFVNSDEYYLVIGVESLYRGKKYNDVCISEIELLY